MGRTKKLQKTPAGPKKKIKHDWGSTVVAYRRNENTVTKGTKKHQLDAFWYIQVFLGLVWNHGQNEKAQKAPKNTESARGGKDGGDLQTKP